MQRDVNGGSLAGTGSAPVPGAGSGSGNGDETSNRGNGGRYVSRTTSTGKVVIKRRRVGKVKDLPKSQRILRLFVRAFFRSDRSLRRDSKLRHFVPAEQLIKIYESCLRSEYVLGANEFKEQLREELKRVGERSDFKRRHIYERAKKCRKQRKVYLGRRLPDPSITSEKNSVEQFLQDRLNDTSLKCDTVTEAFQSITTHLSSYGEVPETDEMGYYGYPDKRAMRIRCGNSGVNNGPQEAVEDNVDVESPPIGNQQPGDTVSQGIFETKGTSGIGKHPPITGLGQSVVSEQGNSVDIADREGITGGSVPGGSVPSGAAPGPSVHRDVGNTSESVPEAIARGDSSCGPHNGSSRSIGQKESPCIGRDNPLGANEEPVFVTMNGIVQPSIKGNCSVGADKLQADSGGSSPEDVDYKPLCGTSSDGNEEAWDMLQTLPQIDSPIISPKAMLNLLGEL